MIVRKIGLPEYNFRKRCRKCGRNYGDGSLSSCLEDGEDRAFAKPEKSFAERVNFAMSLKRDPLMGTITQKSHH